MPKVLRIASARDGFMRAGHPHPAKPTDYALGFFSKDQLAAIKAEPMLTVEEVEADEAAPIITGDVAAPLASGLLVIALGNGKAITLAELVAIGVHNAGLAVAAWNRLSEADRLRWLQAALDDAVTAASLMPASSQAEDAGGQPVAEDTSKPKPSAAGGDKKPSKK